VIGKQANALIFIALLLAIAAPAAEAQWQPQWSTPWHHPEPFHSASPLRVRVAADGTTFAGVDVTHHSTAHVALVRFNADGSFAWTRERTAFSLAGIAFVGADRVAIAGDGGVVLPVYVRLYDAASGDVVWDREAGGGETAVDARHDTQQLAVDASGNLMILASDNGDFVVIRFDANGDALPTWRRTIDADHDVHATGIVALPDGGAIVTGEGRTLGGGYVTVRLDAQGGGVFTDVDLGGIANPLGPSYLALDADGNAVVAAAPESSGGVPRAQVWKLSPTGARAWTKILPNPGSPTSGMSVGGFMLASNGDALVVVDAPGGTFRLLRLAAATGEVVWDVNAPTSGSPSTLGLAPNGRVLIGGYAFVGGGGQVSGRIAEFAANGEPCRVAEDLDMSSAVEASAGAGGWSVLGSTSFIQGVGSDAFVRRYDAEGACTLTDRLFVDGFDGS
jgi:hypothetical protein